MASHRLETRLASGQPLVMGILNVTPDSFSDGGSFLESDAALSRIEAMVEEGADLIDIGGESTRPGATSVSAAEEQGRVLPVLEAAIQRFDIPFSVDSSQPALVDQAIKLGLELVNDVRGFRDPDLQRIVSRADVFVCIMHMRGAPDTMQEQPVYQDAVVEIRDWLRNQAAQLCACGMPSTRIILDPGFGFGKRLSDNFQLLAHLNEISDLGYPVLAGLSRKSMLGAVTDRSIDQRYAASIAGAALAVAQGARIIRAHDVAATRDAVRVAHAMNAARMNCVIEEPASDRISREGSANR